MKELQKVWFAYIKALLQKNLNISSTHNKYYINILKETMQRSYTLQRISERISWPEGKKLHLVKVPIWNQVNFSEHLSSWFKHFSSWSRQIETLFIAQKWIFNLDKSLRSNIKFDYIAIHINYFYVYIIGFVEVKSFMIPMSDEWAQIYCGI